MISCSAIAFISLLVASLACSSSALRDAAVPFTSPSRRLAFVPRGGGVDDGAADDDAVRSVAPERRRLVGVIDLRPEPDADGIISLRERAADGRGDSVYDVIGEALFPIAAKGDDDDIVDEAEMNKRAASSRCVGDLCDTVYLVIAYDFEGGKTSLHRSFGGAKLMAFVDGARSRWHKAKESGGAQAARLVLLLVPSSSASAITLLSNLPSTDANNSGEGSNMILLSNTNSPLLNRIVLDLQNCSDWDESGARFLVDRLSEAFALGGEEFQGFEPFDTEMVGVFDVGRDEGSDADSGNGISEVVIRHIACKLRDEQSDAKGDTIIRSGSVEEALDSDGFQRLIKSTYAASGGADDDVSFQ